MKPQSKRIAAIIVNGCIVILEIIGFILSIKGLGLSMFQYYTQDSNYFALFASVLFEIFAIRSLVKNQSLPNWVASVRYMATCCLSLTFLVVLFVLIPMSGFTNALFMLTSGSMLYYHLLCPILCVVSFLLFETDTALEQKNMWASMIPTTIYAIVIVFLNLIQTIRGPYPFLYIYEQPVFVSVVWVFVILGIALLISWLLWLARKRAIAKTASALAA